MKEDFEAHKDYVNDCISKQDERISGIVERMDNLQDEVDDNDAEARARSLMAEYNSKRFNFLIFGVTDPQAYESKSECLTLVREFLEQTAQVPGAEHFRINDCHRLPQRPIEPSPETTHVKRRPIIVKLASLIDKDIIFKNLKDLPAINEHRLKGSKYFVSDHLPRPMKVQKDNLMYSFRKAKKEGKKPYFKPDATTGDYCLHIGKTIIRPK